MIKKLGIQQLMEQHMVLAKIIRENGVNCKFNPNPLLNYSARLDMVFANLRL